MNINTFQNFQYNYSPIFNANFTKTEKEMMQKVKDYTLKHGVETCRIIKKGRDITKKFDLFETFDYVSIGPKDGKIMGINFGVFGRIFNFKRNIKGATYVHSHTTELPLSRPDVIFAVKTKLKKIIAVTPSGKHSTLDLNTKQDLSQSLNIFDEALNKYNELKQQYGDNVLINETSFKIYQDFVKNIWSRFVALTKVKYNSNI